MSSAGGGTSGGEFSQHPADRLIRELIQTRRNVGAGEIERIIERVATSPFDPRVLPVPGRLRGLTYRGRPLGDRSPTLTTHLVQRVVADGQGADGATEAVYLAGLRLAVQEPLARLLVYPRRGGHIAATLTATDQVVPLERRGPRPLPLLYVVYSADRGIIISGYQASSLLTLSIPGDTLWLRR